MGSKDGLVWKFGREFAGGGWVVLVFDVSGWEKVDRVVTMMDRVALIPK